MRKEIILPPMAESEVQRIMGFSDGIVFVIKLIRSGEKMYPSQKARAALGCLADLLEQKLPDDIRQYAEAICGKSEDENATWH